MQLLHFHDFWNLGCWIGKIQQGICVYVVSSCQYVTHLQLSFYISNVSNSTSLFKEKKKKKHKPKTQQTRKHWTSKKKKEFMVTQIKNSNINIKKNSQIESSCIYCLHPAFSLSTDWECLIPSIIFELHSKQHAVSSLCYSLTNITYLKILFSCWASHHSLSCPTKGNNTPVLMIQQNTVREIMTSSRIEFLWELHGKGSRILEGNRTLKESLLSAAGEQSR